MAKTANVGQVKSTMDALEVSPSKSQASSTPYKGGGTLSASLSTSEFHPSKGKK